MTFPFIPPLARFFNAGHQGRIKIQVQVNVNYPVFLTAPEGFPDSGSAFM